MAENKTKNKTTPSFYEAGHLFTHTEGTLYITYLLHEGFKSVGLASRLRWCVFTGMLPTLVEATEGLVYLLEEFGSCNLLS